jgi:hypothetical protein
LLISPPNFYNKTDIIIAEKAKEIEEMFILRGPLSAKEIYDIKTDKFIYLLKTTQQTLSSKPTNRSTFGPMRECHSGDAVGSESINFGEFCFVLMGFFFIIYF